MARLTLTVLAAASLVACGGDDTGGAGSTPDAPATASGSTPATEPVPSASDPGPTQPQPMTTETVGEVDLTGTLPGQVADPCSLLTVEEVGALLANPIAQPPALGGLMQGCSWMSEDQFATLDLDLLPSFAMGEAVDIATFASTSMDPDVADGLEPIEVGSGGLAGPDGSDALVLVLAGDSILQLKYWTVGPLPRPGETWPADRDALVQLAEAATARL